MGGRGVPGPGDGAGARERVVDPVHAAGGQGLALEGVADGEGGAFLGESGGGGPEPGEDLLRLQVEACQRLDDRTELAHRDGRLEALARDAADHQGRPRAGQGESVPLPEQV